MIEYEKLEYFSLDEIILIVHKREEVSSAHSRIAGITCVCD